MAPIDLQEKNNRPLKIAMEAILRWDATRPKQTQLLRLIFPSLFLTFFWWFLLQNSLTYTCLNPVLPNLLFMHLSCSGALCKIVQKSRSLTRKTFHCYSYFVTTIKCLLDLFSFFRQSVESELRYLQTCKCLENEDFDFQNQNDQSNRVSHGGSGDYLRRIAAQVSLPSK